MAESAGISCMFVDIEARFLPLETMIISEMKSNEI